MLITFFSTLTITILIVTNYSFAMVELTQLGSRHSNSLIFAIVQPLWLKISALSSQVRRFD